MADVERTALALLGLGLAAVVAYVGYVFVAPLTVAVFVYYATRPVYRRLGALPVDLPASLRASVSILFIGVPLVLLVGYTVVLVAVETQALVERYRLFETLLDGADSYIDTDRLPDPTFESVFEAYRSGEFDAAIGFLRQNLTALTGFVTGFLFNLFVVTVTAYYLLVDGARLRSYVLRYDESGVLRRYLDAADRELSSVLFGNLLNVLVVGVVGVVVFTAYNAYVPAAVEIPSPALAGALTGVASLIPVVGMKVVYVPLAGYVAVRTFLAGDTSLLVYVAGFVGVTAVAVDFVPDIVLRPYLSGERTHVGLLMLAYIFGPAVFGVYGLFFAPIVLVLALTFADVALPHLLGVDEEQKTLDGF
ncbi:MAG: putative PurR-regulated permease PerM [Methanobacteriota archaeon]|jgi:predicted PurR-regulated permease PerM|uniref:AI-2E family transporter n=1 Tax=Halorutilus salinus TaxID=2487751 RepID=A0A9Q4C282_9EURY|nr:AI-2E family transporter [Halorutilus salinus]MCX2818547.1 AI-2E family transporter [Halorutilus salinus]